MSNHSKTELTVTGNIAQMPKPMRVRMRKRDKLGRAETPNSERQAKLSAHDNKTRSESDMINRIESFIVESSRFDLMNGKWSASNTTVDLEQALQHAFEYIGNDLGPDAWNDLKDPEFIDWARDHMADAKVPRDLIDKAAKWLKSGNSYRTHVKEDSHSDLVEIVKLCSKISHGDASKMDANRKRYGITINTVTLLPQIKALASLLGD